MARVVYAAPLAELRMLRVKERFNSVFHLAYKILL